MSSFSYGLGLLILLFGFSVAWLAVAVFVSNEMAGLMGLLVILFWFAVFMPVLVVREAVWRAKQGALIRKYREMQAQGTLVGDGSGTSVMMASQMQGAGHLPQMALQQDYAPWAENTDPYKRPHEGQFTRSLILLAAGCIMLIGASSATVRDAIYSLAESFQPPAINWDQVVAGEEDDALALRSAARVALFRENACGRILSGQVVRAPDVVYEFVCAGSAVDKGGFGSYAAWVVPAELERKGLSAFTSVFKQGLRVEQAEAACDKALVELLGRMGRTMRLAPKQLAAGAPTSLALKAKYPYADHMRLISVTNLITESGQNAIVRSNCWVGSDGQASVRLLKAPTK
jgi:hypothetical protein